MNMQISKRSIPSVKLTLLPCFHSSYLNLEMGYLASIYIDPQTKLSLCFEMPCDCGQTWNSLCISPLAPLKHNIVLKIIIFWQKLLIRHASGYNTHSIIYKYPIQSAYPSCLLHHSISMLMWCLLVNLAIQYISWYSYDSIDSIYCNTANKATYCIVSLACVLSIYASDMCLPRHISDEERLQHYYVAVRDWTEHKINHCHTSLHYVLINIQ